MKEKILTLWHYLINLITAYIAPRPRHNLLKMVDEARRTWHEALNEYNFIDREMADYMIFKINASERRFIALLRQAHRQGVTAWPPDLPGPVKGLQDACGT